MKSNILQLIYDKMFILINDASKASQNILLRCEFSELLEKQKNNSTNSSTMLEDIDNRVKQNSTQIQKEINTMLELNLYMGYYIIPLNEYLKHYENLTQHVGKIKDNSDSILRIYKKMVTSTGYIKIDKENWDELIEKQKQIKELINEWRNQIREISLGIQEKYFKKMLSFKTK